MNVRRPAAASLDDKIAALERAKEMDEDEDAGPMPPTPSGSDSDGGGGSGSDDEPAAPPGAKQARPPPPDEADLYCAVCDVRVTSVALMREHRRGKKHLEAAKESEARAGSRYCEVCALAFTASCSLPSTSRVASTRRGRRVEGLSWGFISPDAMRHT